MKQKTREELQAQYEASTPLGNRVHGKSLQLNRLLTIEELEAIVDAYLLEVEAFVEKRMVG